MFIIIVSLAAAARAYMFGRWLMKSGNRPGAFAVYLIAAACVGLAFYRYLTAP